MIDDEKLYLVYLICLKKKKKKGQLAQTRINRSFSELFYAPLPPVAAGWRCLHQLLQSETGSSEEEDEEEEVVTAPQNENKAFTVSPLQLINDSLVANNYVTEDAVGSGAFGPGPFPGGRTEKAEKKNQDEANQVGEIVDLSATDAVSSPGDLSKTGANSGTGFYQLRRALPRPVLHVGASCRADHSEAEHQVPGLYLGQGASDGDASLPGDR